MDIPKIGNFLKELRKEHHMTQEQLGEKIGVTNKTISRWETGSYLPPVEHLKLLSELYQISINEILTGDRMEQEDYRDIAEHNITAILKETEKRNKIFERNMFLTMAITTVFAIAIILLLPDADFLPAEEKIKEIIICLLVLAMTFIANTLNLMAIVLYKDKKYPDSISH